jgi:hypothetical protein
VLLTLPSERWTPTAYGAENMSTWVVFSHRPESLSVYSDQLNRMLRFGSLGFCTAGCTSPPVVSRNTSFCPYEK